ncbi:MAG: hypothetical protein EA426_12805 [Spirochaetaceae bacterium]|nr:MAG: hypothetical protein EA426_12805 [Spirochaetaceae bacterium]
MARYSRIGAAPRIFLLILLNFVMIAGGALWFDYLGIIDVKDVFGPALRILGLQPRPVYDDPDGLFLLDSARIAKQEDAILLVSEKLDRRESEIDERLNELGRMQEELEFREEEIRDRENSFNERVRQYENRRAVLEQISRDLVNMRPEEAVAILVGYDDQMLIETLRVTEEIARAEGEFSFVPLWLSRLPAQRAAEIQRKMTIRPPQ